MTYHAADPVEVTRGPFEGYTGGVLWQRGNLVRVNVHGIHALTFHTMQLRLRDASHTQRPVEPVRCTHPSGRRLKMNQHCIPASEIREGDYLDTLECEGRRRFCARVDAPMRLSPLGDCLISVEDQPQQRFRWDDPVKVWR